METKVLSVSSVVVSSTRPRSAPGIRPQSRPRGRDGVDARGRLVVDSRHGRMERLPRSIAGRYRVISKLGAGGQGVVYECLDRESRGELKKVALKLLNREATEKTLAIYEHEFRKLQRFHQHPNIVNVLEYGSFEKRPYITLEYLDGRTLDQHVAVFAQKDYQEIARLLSQVLRALGYIHDHGHIHQDVKHNNVIVVMQSNGPDKAVILDFGFVTREPGSEAVGTMDYMAPELLLPRDYLPSGGSIDHRVDLYSVGVLGYYLLTAGMYPSGKKEYIDHAETMRLRLRNRRVSPIRKYDPEVPEALESIILRLMSRERNNRHESAYEAVLELSRLFPDIESDSYESPEDESLSYEYYDGAGVSALVMEQHARSQSTFLEIRGRRGYGKTSLLQRELAPLLGRHSEVILCSYAAEATRRSDPFTKIPNRLRARNAERARELEKQYPALFQQEEAVVREFTANQLEDELAGLLQIELGKTNLVILVDDVQRANPAFESFLSAAHRAGHGSNADTYLMVVCTVCLDGAAEPVDRATAALSRYRRLTRAPDPIILREFNRRQIRAYLDKIAPRWEGSVDSLVTMLLERSGGAPRQMSRLLDELGRGDAIDKTAVCWRINTQKLAAFANEETIQDTAELRQRLSRMPLPAVNILQVLAALGSQRGASSNDLEAICDLTESEVTEGVAYLQDAGFVREAAHQFRVAGDDKVQLYRVIEPASQKEQIHLRIGRHLLELYKANEEAHIEELAYHFERSSDYHRGFELGVRCARRLTQQHRHLWAIPHYRFGLELSERAGASDRAIADLHLELGAAILSALGPEHFAEAEEQIQAASKLGRKTGDLALTARCAIVAAQAKSYRWSHVIGEYPDEVETCRQSLEALVPKLMGDDLDTLRLRGDLLFQLAFIYRRQNRNDDAYRTAFSALDISRTLGRRNQNRLLSLAASSRGAGTPEELAEKVRLAEEALQIAAEENDPTGTVRAHKALAMALFQDDRAELAWEELSKAAKIAEQPYVGVSELSAVLQLHADSLAEACRAEEAIPLARAIIDKNPHGKGTIVARGRLVLGKALYRLCRYPEAEAQLMKVAEYAKGRPRDVAMNLQTKVYLARIRTELGDLEEALRGFREAIDGAGLTDKGSTIVHTFVLDALLSMGEAIARRGWVEFRRGEDTQATGAELASVCSEATSISVHLNARLPALQCCALAFQSEGDPWEVGRSALQMARDPYAARTMAPTAFYVALGLLVADHLERGIEAADAALEALEEVQMTDLSINAHALRAYGFAKQGRPRPAKANKEEFLDLLRDVSPHTGTYANAFAREPFRMTGREQELPHVPR